MKRRYFFHHPESDCVWTQMDTEENVNEFLNSNIDVELLNEKEYLELYELYRVNICKNT